MKIADYPNFQVVDMQRAQRLFSIVSKANEKFAGNAALLESFASIIQTPQKPLPQVNNSSSTSSSSGRMLGLHSAVKAASASQFDASNLSMDRPRNVDYGGHRFLPGNNYLPMDIAIGMEHKMVIRDPFVEVRKHVDIFHRTRYDLKHAHMNVGMLSSFLSPLGRILDRRQTHLSAKSQRRITKCIKRARQMGLLPYMYRPKVSN